MWVGPSFASALERTSNPGRGEARPYQRIADSEQACFPMDRIFRLQQNHTTVGREIIAGLTTFAAMAYILVVNPSILGKALVPH